MTDDGTKTPGGPTQAPNVALSPKRAKGATTSLFRRVLKVSVALALLGLSAQALLAGRDIVASDNAVVSANMLAVRSPIEGTLSGVNLRVGTKVRAGEIIGHVSDPYVDDRRLIDMKQALIRDEADRDAYVRERDALDLLLATLHKRADNYNKAFAAYLQQEVAEARSNIAAAVAAKNYQDQETNRQDTLGSEGWSAPAGVDQSRSRAIIADNTLAAAAAHALYLQDRADAAARGMSLDSGSNDVSYSEQRADQVAIQLTDVERNLASFSAAADEDRARLRSEEERVALLRSFDIKIPDDGVVWQVNALSGSNLTAGSMITQIVDCRDAFIIAIIPQDRFPDVVLGGSVHIRMTGETTDIIGVVASILGNGSLSYNADYAVMPNLQRTPAGAVAIITLPASATKNGCLIGRTARVLLPAKAPRFTL